MPPEGPETQAARLLRWYPRTWRSRYGEEFAELLIADITEQARVPTARTLDVARAAAHPGPSSPRPGSPATGRSNPIRTVRRARSSLAWLACSLAVFLGFGVAM